MLVFLNCSKEVTMVVVEWVRMRMEVVDFRGWYEGIEYRERNRWCSLYIDYGF